MCRLKCLKQQVLKYLKNIYKNKYMLQFNYDIRVMNFFRNNLQNKYINFAFFTQ